MGIQILQEIFSSKAIDIGLMPIIIKYMWTICLYLVLSLITYEDIKTMIVSDRNIKAGYILGLFFNLSLVIFNNEYVYSLLIFKNLLSSILVLITMNILTLIFNAIFQKKSLGVGDSKLTSVATLWIGLEGILLAMSLAFVSAAIFSLIAKSIGKLRRFQAFAFTPFISISVILVWSLGKNFWINRWFELWGL